MVTKEYNLNIYGDIIETVFNDGIGINNIIKVPQVKKLFKEKQDLIKYLEDKIKIYKDELKELEKYPDSNDYEITEVDSKIEICQEILEKIKEGNYE